MVVILQHLGLGIAKEAWCATSSLQHVLPLPASFMFKGFGAD